LNTCILKPFVRVFVETDQLYLLFAAALLRQSRSLLTGGVSLVVLQHLEKSYVTLMLKNVLVHSLKNGSESLIFGKLVWKTVPSTSHLISP
jgi:hypothetical protein